MPPENPNPKVALPLGISLWAIQKQWTKSKTERPPMHDMVNERLSNDLLCTPHSHIRSQYSPIQMVQFGTFP